MNIAPSDQPRRVTPQVEAELAAFETMAPGESVPMSPEAWKELARRKRAEIVSDTAAAEEPGTADEGWAVIKATLQVLTFLLLAIAAVALYAKWWAVQP